MLFFNTKCSIKQSREWGNQMIIFKLFFKKQKGVFYLSTVEVLIGEQDPYTLRYYVHREELNDYDSFTALWSSDTTIKKLYCSSDVMLRKLKGTKWIKLTPYNSLKEFKKSLRMDYSEINFINNIPIKFKDYCGNLNLIHVPIKDGLTASCWKKKESPTDFIRLIKNPVSPLDREDYFSIFSMLLPLKDYLESLTHTEKITYHNYVVKKLSIPIIELSTGMYLEDVELSLYNIFDNFFEYIVLKNIKPHEAAHESVEYANALLKSNRKAENLYGTMDDTCKSILENIIEKWAKDIIRGEKVDKSQENRTGLSSVV